jgi:hypothetical protein
MNMIAAIQKESGQAHGVIRITDMMLFIPDIGG